MSEPWHRQWLHALEADSAVPGTVMQIARIYADYAASRSGRTASVTLPQLVRQTHRTRDTIIDAIRWLVSHGWLILLPIDGESWRSGQRKEYLLTLAAPPERSSQSTGRASRLPQKRPAQSTGRASRPEAVEPAGRKRSSQPAGSGPPSRPVEPAGRSGRASRPEAVEPAGRERLTSFTSLSPLSPRGLHAALAEVVPDVTERESDQVRAMIGRRPGVVSAAAVMQAEIRQGNGPDLVAQVRGVARREPAPPTWHEFREAVPGQCECGHVKSATVHRPRQLPGE